MIIVSQDRKSIYNFDNIRSIDVMLDEVFVVDDILADIGVSIGIYKTDEIANNVLQDMIAAIEAGVKTYKMPK